MQAIFYGWTLTNIDTKTVFKYQVADYLYNQSFNGKNTHQLFNTDVTVNLGVAYANMPVTGTMIWQYTDDHYPDELSSNNRANISKVADSQGKVVLNTFVSEGTAYSTISGTTYTLALNSGGRSVYNGRLVVFYNIY